MHARSGRDQLATPDADKTLNGLHVPVAIVGAGPVGLVAANLLGQAGVRCALIEQSAGTSEHPRAQTIDDESMRTLQALGCAKRFQSLIRPAAGSIYTDESGEVIADIGPGPRNYGYTKRYYMLQQQLDSLLLNSLGSYPSVSQHFSTRVESIQADDKPIRLTLAGGEQITCDYLLACDGGQSEIRKALNIQMQGWTYEQDWIVLDALDDPDNEPVSRFICDPARPMVSIASPGNGRRYEFMLLPGEDQTDVLSDAHLAKLLSNYRPWDPAKITRRAVYTFHARLAEKLQSGSVFLLGDSAHLTPPFAGQGMNAGIRDSLNLAWKLALVCNGDASADMLRSYELERRGPMWSMIQVAVAMGEFVMPVGDEQIALKTSMLKALERFPQARNWLFEARFKPKPRYDDGWFVDLNNQPIEASLVGEMLPQPQVLDANNRLRLLDDLFGPGFCLLVQDDQGQAAIEQLSHPVWQKLAPRFVRLNFDGELPDPDGVITTGRLPDSKDFDDAQANRQYARPIRTHRGQVMLIRPDRYVAGACFTPDMATFEEKVQALLGVPE